MGIYELRDARAADRQEVIDLIDGVYREYGDRVVLDRADADLVSVPDSYTARGGAFIVAECSGSVVGCHAALPLEGTADTATFRRLYITSSHRRRGLGRQLMDWAVAWAREQQLRRIEFWSDTRFADAHKFFRGYGFCSDGTVREMQDGWTDYAEYFFECDLDDLP